MSEYIVSESPVYRLVVDVQEDEIYIQSQYIYESEWVLDHESQIIIYRSDFDKIVELVAASKSAGER